MKARYKISARPREEFPGFWRGGRFFPNAPQYVILDENDISPSILNEPMLVWEKIEENSEEGNSKGKGRKAGEE